MAKPIKLFDRKHPPKSVTLLGYKIQIKVVAYLEDEGEDLLGAWNHDNKTIFLLRGCDWKSVLLHELMHAGISLTGACAGISMTSEERIVLALEHAIAPLL